MSKDIGQAIGNITSKLAEISAMQTMMAVNGIGKRGYPWPAQASLATGASMGTVQTLAAILASPEGVSNDTMLFTALLVAASVSVSQVPDKPGVVQNDFVQEPTTFLTAMGMFEKLTGRKIDSALRSEVLAHANLGNTPEGAALLNAVCANHKPA